MPLIRGGAAPSHWSHLIDATVMHVGALKSACRDFFAGGPWPACAPAGQQGCGRVAAPGGEHPRACLAAPLAAMAGPKAGVAVPHHPLPPVHRTAGLAPLGRLSPRPALPMAQGINTMSKTLWIPSTRRWQLKTSQANGEILAAWKGVAAGRVALHSTHAHVRAGILWILPSLASTKQVPESPKECEVQVRHPFEGTWPSCHLEACLGRIHPQWSSLTVSALLQVFDAKDWEALMVRSILPKLAWALSDALVINPSDQDLAAWHWVTAWAPYMPMHLMVNLLEVHFFPKWHDVLRAWVSHSPNYMEVEQWYLNWKVSPP